MLYQIWPKRSDDMADGDVVYKVEVDDKEVDHYMTEERL